MLKLLQIACLLKTGLAQMTIDVPIDLYEARQSSTFVSDNYPKAAFPSNPITNEADESNPVDWLSVEPYACSRTELDDFPWWTAKMNDTYKIKEVQILTRNDPSRTEYLEDVSIMIGDTICAQTGTDIAIGEWHTYECENGPIHGDDVSLFMEQPGRLSFCGLKVIAHMDIKDYIELQSAPIYEQLSEVSTLAECKVHFFGWYFFCTAAPNEKELKEKSGVHKYFRYFLKNTLKYGIMYSSWTFYLQATHQEDGDLDKALTKKIKFFSQWSLEEGEDVYYKTNKYQYNFIDSICEDSIGEIYTIPTNMCQFLWTYWRLDMAIVIFYSLFLVDFATHFDFLRSWYTRVDDIATLFL